MPIYEFQCTECREIFEDMVPVGQKTHKCPVCGKKSKKIISPVGIIFKGSGWYCKDNNKPTANGNGKRTKEKVTEVTEEVKDKTDSKTEESTTTSKKKDKD